ncbi:oxidoreductase [Paenibacillus darwinianus]|uniref:Oxidoreductase n=1 Tax=Paenibacillus darwinianus TaxID=1380763 RepID=A0A9W5W7H3_9BACL|nr:Gfo/Idh/MocA family oxidoreductase [Paenibacillus darwinianus]EXX87973.1 oxidoreductase [Paenibacillus darwinianus]EXX88039.1 oxidoreductase [Paenibacillus darwinianus]EXX89201.1 oxidoreductase [Paenibacillus darwinianus]
MEKVRFLMIGVGGMGREHIRRLQDVPEAEIVGLADPSAESVAQVKMSFPQLENVPVYTDYREAIAQSNADAGIIVSPHRLHFEQGMACLDGGLHVLMEKPFVDGSVNAARIIAHAESVGMHLAIAYQRHLMGPFIYIRDLVQSGALGKINFITAYQAQNWLELAAGTWRQKLALSCGGQLNDSGSHLLDVVVWMTGLEPESVSAFIDNRGTEVDIDSAVTVRFREGAVGTFNVVGSASIGWHEDVSIHGEYGTVLFRNNRIWVAKAGQTELAEVPESELPASSDPNRDFVDLVLGRISEAAAPSTCGLRIARLTEAAWRSAAEGCRVVSLLEETVV